LLNVASVTLLMWCVEREVSDFVGAHRYTPGNVNRMTHTHTQICFKYVSLIIMNL